jgi:chromosome segregation ATPase
MDSKTIEGQLHEAQRELEQLKADLPHYERLLADNKAEAGRLQQGNAGQKALTQTEGRVNVARELLEQHHSDIANARKKVICLELAYRHSKAIDKMAAQAKRLMWSTLGVDPLWWTPKRLR